MRLPGSFYEGKEKILDLGGWFKPEPVTTHVVDAMPWETRGAKINLERLPGERFSKDTWYQLNFLDPDFSLPFPDKFFDLVLCGHTVEDLVSPGRLLEEMQRVGRAGVIQCPSRTTEQTLGMRDRMSRLPGHPHHHWIVDSIEGELILCSKEQSQLSAAARLVPLAFFENLRRTDPQADLVTHAWLGSFRTRFPAAAECRERAETFVRPLGITCADRLHDAALRGTRRLRARLRGRAREDMSWWPDILEKSRPYSRIPLG